MKIWYGFGSEHSANLVMIGRFKDAEGASRAKEIIDQLTEQVNADIQDDLMEIGAGRRSFTDGMLDRLRELKVYSLGPTELEQLAYDVAVTVEGDDLVVRTDELDVLVFLKIMLDQEARIEVYSAHNYPPTEQNSDE